MNKALFLLPLLGALPLQAGFPQPVQQVTLTCGQKHATVVFETDGTDIRKAKPLCDCTTTRFQGTRLTAEVDTSTFDTDTEKQIDATTADGKRTRLTMRFAVPPAIVLSARSLVWKQGASPAPQQLTITLPKGSPIQGIQDAGLSGDSFDFVPETVSRGREYRLTVTPKSTGKRCLERLVIKTGCTDPRYAQRIIYLQVK